MLASGLLVFSLSLFLSIGDMSAQNNEWKTSAPNPPSGLTTDASGLVANGAKDFDFDLFESEVNQEVIEVNNSTNYSSVEKKVRVKVLAEALRRASEGFAIVPSFDLAFNMFETIVENDAPSVDLLPIIDEYKNKFEQ